MSAAWWTTPQGERRLVLNVIHGVEGVDHYDCFALDLTRELAALLLERIALVARWQEADRDLDFVAFHDAEGEYYGRDYDSEEFDDEGNGPPTWERGDWDSRTEIDRLHVGPGVAGGWCEWSAWVKHSDPPIKLTTETLEADDLRRFVAGDDPWPTIARAAAATGEAQP